MYLSNGIDVQAEWADSIAWSTNGSKWNPIQKDGLSVKSISTQRRSGALNQNSGRDHSIIVTHQGNNVLNFKLPIQNQPTWTNNHAGATQALSDINEWLSQTSGDATEAKQDVQITELQQIKANQFTIESTNNKTTTPLGAGGTWVGTADLNGYSDVMIVAETDQDGELYIQFSQDNVNWGFPLTSQYRTDRINPPHIYEKGYRYVRIGFNNTSANAQTYLRVAAYYGNHMTPLTAPLNGTLAESYDATVVRPSDYHHEVAMGKRQGRNGINKWGHNEDLSANTEEIVAAWGGVFNPVTDIMQTAQTFTITYTNTQDGAGQTGALMLLIDYLDADFNLAQGYHTLGNTGSDVTAFTGLGINRVVVIANGGAGYNNADITMIATTDGTTQAIVVAQGATTDQLIYHTPINHNLLIEWFWGNAIKLSGGSTPTVAYKFYSWSRVTLTRYEVGHVKVDTAVENNVDMNPPIPFVVGGREVFYVTAEANSNGSEVECRLSGTLERVL